MSMIKICGLTSDEDIALVNRLKPELAGFVMFFPKSRRNLEPERAAQLIRLLDGILSVAVTVSPTPDQARLIAQAGFDRIQIHGELYPETLEECSLPIIRAFNVSNMNELAECSTVDKVCGYVFDAAQPGSGKTFDWDSLAALPSDGKPRILAGGLGLDNVSAAIKAVRPDGVDVSSGVELPNGGKDPALAEAFIKNARAAFAQAELGG